ncbi:MAG: ABC transporter permease [Acidobacteriota bacterium]
MTTTRILRAVRDWRRYGYPLIALTRRDLQKRYAGSILGVAWTVVQPLTLIVVYVVVFGVVLRTDRGAGTFTFVLSLLCGMLPYLAINDALQRCSFALREDKTLLERESFPAPVIPASRVVTASVGELVGLTIVVIMALVGGVASPWIVMLPVLVLLRFALTLALGWIVSLLAVFISDLNEMLSLLLTVWLFLTPVFYPPDAVPHALRWTLWVNPLHHVASAYRAVIMGGRAPWPETGWLVLDVVVVLGCAVWFFRNGIDRGKDLL